MERAGAYNEAYTGSADAGNVQGRGCHPLFWPAGAMVPAGEWENRL